MAVYDERLREAIELAFVVAVIGNRQRPPMPVPAAIRPYLRFHKLPAAALGPVRRAVEADDEFRSRVALAATPELAGEAGVLWLQRPQGWQQQLDELVAGQAAAEEVEEGERAERSASRRVEAAEHAARVAAADLASVRAELAAEAKRFAELQRVHDKLERRAAQLEVELGGARRRLTDAQQREQSSDEHLARVRASAKAESEAVHRAQLAALQAELDAWREQALAAISPGATAGSGDAAPAAIEPSMPGVDVGRLAAALADAAKAADALGRALADAGYVIEGVIEGAAAGVVEPARTPGTLVERAPIGPGRPKGARARLREARPSRVAVTLPGGVLADSVDAALHLLRVRGVLVVVDGYNVAKLGWPDLALAEQRRRLLDAMDEVVVRHGTRVQVVFDAASADALGRHTPRRLARVAFSPAGVLADDVIVDLVTDLPSGQAVVVVTNDNELRIRVRRHGANVLASEQLLGAARRST